MLFHTRVCARVYYVRVNKWSVHCCSPIVFNLWDLYPEDIPIMVHSLKCGGGLYVGS